jgi:hypothetical protein
MKHVKHVSRRSPAIAEVNNMPLTKRLPGLFGLNELGDFALAIGNLVDFNLPFVSKWNIMPTGPGGVVQP